MMINTVVFAKEQSQGKPHNSKKACGHWQVLIHDFAKWGAAAKIFIDINLFKCDIGYFEVDENGYLEDKRPQFRDFCDF